MIKNLNFCRFFFACIFLSVLNPIFNVNSAEFTKIELKKELTKGNFLIGLKQYLGGEKDSFSKDKNITFSTEDAFLFIHSSNGIKHKSKKINIVWKNIPLKNPISIEKRVFGPYASYESAKQKANFFKNKGFEATVAYPKNWEVWISNENNFPSNKFKYKLSKKTNKTKIIPFIENEYISRKLEGPIYVFSDENIKINNINFGKKFYLAQDSYGTWTLIQKIRFDKYLEGVLPHEIGPNSPLEALKAQAVIARTWAIFNSERFNMDKYHLCITTQCQVYKQPNMQNRKVNKAIRETSNKIITYKNQPINAFYHGTNGGISSKSSESWRIRDYSYFQTKIDSPSLTNNSFDLPIANSSTLNQFFDLDPKKFYGSDHYLFRWSRKISSAKIKDYLIKNELINHDNDVLALNIIERGPSGRVIKLELNISNSNNSILLVKDDIRRILQFLPSNLFTINKLNDNFWVFRGGGFGHGVGLSQSGAIEMAKMGFNYEQILHHYYQGTKLKKFKMLHQ